MTSRCYYEVLAVQQDASAAEIKKSYHAQALKYHPDKNAGDDRATEMFRQVQEAYEVLSNPQERAYYDDNREQVLMSDDEDEEEKQAAEVEAELDFYKWASRDAFVDFSHAADGFFSVYGDVFRKLHEQEKTARHGDVPRPDFGGAGSEVERVTAFYAYWLSFSSCRSDRAFAQHDKWDLSEAPSPMMRRLMHQKNMAVREKARAMFNDKARRLAAWVKTHDPRACGPIGGQGRGGEGAAGGEQAAEEKGWFECAACNKRYKNAQQLANHEKSGKHKQVVARLNRQLREDDGLKELEELAVDEGEQEGEGAHGDDERGDAAGGGGRGRRKKGRRPAAGEGADADAVAADDDDDAAIAAAMSTALPSPGLVALQTRQAFESTEEYKKMNKTQRRKALLQWEAENEHIMRALRSEGKEPKPEAEKPKEKKPDVPQVREKLHGSGAHSRESKTPKAKQKAVYGKPKN